MRDTGAHSTPSVHGGVSGTSVSAQVRSLQTRTRMAPGISTSTPGSTSPNATGPDSRRQRLVALTAIAAGAGRGRTRGAIFGALSSRGAGSSSLSPGRPWTGDGRDSKTVAANTAAMRLREPRDRAEEISTAPPTSGFHTDPGNQAERRAILGRDLSESSQGPARFPLEEFKGFG